MSRYGLVAFGSSLDCVSVFGSTVADAARVLGVIAGPRSARCHHRRRARRCACRCRGPTCSRDSSSACRGSISRPTSTRACAPRCDRADRGMRDLGATHRRGVAAALAATRCRPTTSSRRPKPRPTSRATTASGTARARRAAGDVRALYRATRGQRLRRRGAAPHPGRHLRAERRLLRRVLRQGAGVRALHRRRFRRGLRVGRGPAVHADDADHRRSGPARRPTIRSRCTWPTSSSAR